MSNPIKLLSESVLPRYAGLIILFGACVLAFYAPPTKSAPGSDTTAVASPTPVKKSSNSASVNKKLPTNANTNSSKNLSVPKTEPTPQVIVSVTAARLRSAATTSSAELRRLKLGTILPVMERTSGANFWYKVQFPAGSKYVTGWVSSTVAANFEAAKAETIYRQLASKNFKSEGMSYGDAVEVYDFLTRVLPEVKTNEIAAELGLKRLQSLAAALDAIGVMNSDKQPYKTFTNAQDKNIVYSDPAGQWFVRADLFWDLHKKYSGTSAGEEIAWAAARTSLPGECEGYINCYLYLLRETDGEYLSLYPAGKHALEALKNISAFLEPIVADLKDKKIYSGPTDTSDRAEYNRHLADLRLIISRLPLVEKDKPLRQIGLMAEAYR